MGGKSGGGNQYSGGNDNLWNTQSEQVRQSMAMSGEMFDYWRNYAPGYLENTANMVDETNNGVLANRLRNQAAADATTSMGIGLDSATRDMSRYGAEFNPTKASYAARDAGITGALARADAMNKATQYADGLKWARNQDALGQVSGMPGNASQMLGSANSGMSNLASMQNNANSMAAQNAAGYGKLGASLAYGLMKADGGQIKLKDGGRAGSSALGIRLAAGGMPGNPASRTPVQGWRERMAAMPSISMSTPDGGSAIGNVLAGAAPAVAGHMLKEAAAPAWEATKGWLSSQLGSGAAGAGLSAGAAGVGSGLAFPGAGLAAAETAGSIGAGALGSGVSGGLAAPALASAGTTAASGLGSGVAGALGSGVSGSVVPALASAGEAIGGTAAAAGAANAWNPIGWGLLGLAALSSLDLANGGQPKGNVRRTSDENKARKDMTPGGEVTGKGTRTSDSVPAWLSKDEYVLNAETVDIVGKEKLDAINELGLKKRYGDQARMVDGDAKPNGLALGGMLGFAAGAGVDQWAREREQARRDSEAARRQEEFGWERQRAASEMSSLPDRTEAEQSAYRLRTKQNNANLGLSDLQTENARKRLDLEGQRLDSETARQPLESSRQRNDALVAKTLSDYSVEDLPRVLWKKRTEGVFNDADMITGSFAKLGELIEQGDDGRVLWFVNAMNKANPTGQMFPEAVKVGVQQDPNGKEKYFVAEDKNGNAVIKMSASQLQSIRNAVGKSEYKTVNAGDSLVQVKNGSVTPVYTAPESSKSVAQRMGPLERDVNYLMSNHGMTGEQALGHLNSAKTMSREQFVLNALKEKAANSLGDYSQKDRERDARDFGAVYDSVRNSGQKNRGATGSWQEWIQ